MKLIPHYVKRQFIFSYFCYSDEINLRGNEKRVNFLIQLIIKMLYKQKRPGILSVSYK